MTYSVSKTGISVATYSSLGVSSYVMIPDQTTVDKAKQILEDNENNKELTQESIDETGESETES